MARVLSEVFRAIDDVPLAPEVINPVRDALGVDILLCTSSKVLLLLEAEGVLNAVLEHLSRLLAKERMLLMVRLKVLLPRALNKGSHCLVGMESVP